MEILELKNTITIIKNLLDRLNSGREGIEKRVSELKEQ